jgi:Rad3-related DNA helicase
MTLRFIDSEQTIALSVGDVVALGARGGHLSMGLAGRSSTRLRMGQEIHTDYAGDRQRADATYQSEVGLRRQLVVDGWTVTLHGRVDGRVQEDGRDVIEEVKSTVLPADALLATTVEDWPDYRRQLETYLWLADSGASLPPIGRLVLISVLDGSKHVLGVAYDATAVDNDVRAVLERVVHDRIRRLAWLSSRRDSPVPLPYDEWRAGQDDIASKTLQALERGEPMLVQAPTGLGKTGPVLWAALTFARKHDKQVFWATARTTHQAVAQDSIRRLRKAGFSVRAITLRAREKACLNDIVACTPERCTFAKDYYDKAQGAVLQEARCVSDPAPESMRDVAQAHGVCPVELALDASEEVDLVIGDMNYALEPGVRLARHFEGASLKDWVVVIDEAHQLVERARGWGSPRVTLEQAQAAAGRLRELEASEAEPFLAIIEQVVEAIYQSEYLVEGRCRDGVGVADLPRRLWSDYAEQIDALALDYARIEAARVGKGMEPASHPDAWTDFARSVLRFSDALLAAEEETAELVGFGADRFVGLACLDPSKALGPRLAALGGLVGCSATLSPTAYYTTVLGLPEETQSMDVDGVFPAENKSVVVASRVSTTYRDRVQHAPATAALLSRCIEATPGNVAVYFPSFAMLGDLVPRLALAKTDELVVQERGGDDAARAGMLKRLAAGGPRVVLAGVLGGVFAEGVDLPPGSLATVCIVGPGLPPVGLVRDLLRDHHERVHGDGFRYASLIPGLTRVVQAAGRLHRRPEDRGVIVLVGRRFRWRDIRELLPTSWQPELAMEPSDAIAAFFHPSSKVAAP